jgi:hypothetical protein
MHTFHQWVEARKLAPQISESDCLMRLVMHAGPGGIAEGDLKKQIDLPRQSVDQPLAGLLGLGLIVVTGQYGVRVFRPANVRAARFSWQ